MPDLVGHDNMGGPRLERGEDFPLCQIGIFFILRIVPEILALWYIPRQGPAVYYLLHRVKGLVYGECVP